MQVACHISLERFRRGYNFVSDLTSIKGLHKKLWASKTARVPISRISGFPTWESWDKMTFGCRPCGQERRILLKGRLWLPPNSGHGEFCEFVVARGSFVHQKCSNYALINLLFGLCMFVWIIDPLFIRPNSHPRAPTRPSTPEALQTRERTPTSYPSTIFTFGLTFESIKELGGVSVFE
jgi:hypothetical protein